MGRRRKGDRRQSAGTSSGRRRRRSRRNMGMGMSMDMGMTRWPAVDVECGVGGARACAERGRKGETGGSIAVQTRQT